MKAESRERAALVLPRWEGEALVVQCAMCWEHPGSKHNDGSGVCPGCDGAAFKVLATRTLPDERKTQ